MKRAKSFVAAAVVLGIFSLSKGHGQSLGPNGRYYKVVQEANLLWEEARLKAAQSTFNNVHGHLATIASADENEFIDSLRRAIAPTLSVWIGGYQTMDAPSPTNDWFWINGEGAIPFQNGRATYANWAAGEPNEGTVPNIQQRITLGVAGANWTSETDDRHVQGYVIEYPNAGSAAEVYVIATDAIAVEDSLATTNLNIATFSFRRVGDLSQDLPVFYSVSGTALNGSDYDEISLSIVIPAGESSARLDIIPRVDDLGTVEEMETVGIRIEPSLILTPQAAYTIDGTRREAAAVIYEGQAPEAGLELAAPTNGAKFKSGEPVVLLAALSISNQPPAVDFYSMESVGGPSNKLGSASLRNGFDAVGFYEFIWTNASPRSYFVTAVLGDGGAGTLSSHPLAITVNDPPLVKIRSIPVDAGSGASDFASGQFEISRTGPTNENLQVHLAITGDATAGLDYVNLANYVVIGSGRASAKINVITTDDDTPEGEEQITLTLVDSTTPASYIVDEANRQATVSIIDVEGTGPQSSDDLWDLSKGAVVTASSGTLDSSSSLGMLGGIGFAPAEPGTTIFSGGNPSYVEWTTPTPVTVNQIRLFGRGDGDTSFRAFGRFTLKTKSVGSATFDQTVFTWRPTVPFVHLDRTSWLILDANFPAVTANKFRAEFEAVNGGPRVMELDGFGPPPSRDTNVPVVSITSPAPGALTSGGITLAGTVLDNDVASVRYEKNGVASGTIPLSNGTFSLPISVSPGETRLKVIARDVSGNEGSAEVVVTLSPTAPSSDDLWDISRGNVVTASSGTFFEPDTPGLFGGNGFISEPGSTIFADNPQNGFVHFVEWKTLTPVTVSTVRFYGAGDGAIYSNGREAGRFTLKTKSPGSSTFDVTVFSFVPNHPYNMVDPQTFLALETNVTAFTAEEFRGEFVQANLRAEGWNAPRVMELDAFGPSSSGPPQIVNQPVDREGFLGASAAFVVGVTGSAPLSYQWRREGTNLSESAHIVGVNSWKLTINNLTLGDAGDYSVVVKNAEGEVISQNAHLTVSIDSTPPAITKQPASATIFAGETVVLNVEATGSNLTYQWRLNDVPLQGKTAAALEIQHFAAANIGSYSVRIKNGAGEVLSSNARLAMAARATGQLMDINYTAHLNPAFSVKTGPTALGISANDFWNVYSRDVSSELDWRAGGQVNALKWTDGTATSASLIVTNAAGAWVTLSDDPMLKSYLYPLSRIGDITSTLQSLPPQRYDIYVYAHGQTDSESAAVELKLNGAPIEARSTSSQPGWDEAGWVDGNQFVVFRGIEVPSGTTVEVISHPGAGETAVMNGIQLAAQPSVLRIVTQPVSQTVTNGQPVSFSVEAEGNGTLTYQWWKNGVEISGATGPTLTIAAASSIDVGSYVVRVKNAVAVTVSQPATLVVTSGASAQRKLLNIDFTSSNGNIKVGPAAVGDNAADYWNFYNKDTGAINGEPNGPRWSDKTPSGVQLAMTGGLGAWGTGSSDPMLHTYLYTFGAGRITAALTAFPASTVDVYVYAHGLPGSENGVVTVAVNGVSQGQKSTTTINGWDTAGWTEGNEYVVFRNIPVPANATLEIHSDPGVSGQSVINGAQVVASFGVAAPEITKQPKSGTIFAGETAVLSVEATGSNLTYQWRLNEAPLEGKTAATLEIQNFAAANIGSYSVRIKNGAGEVLSSNARLAMAARATGELMDINYTAHLNAGFSVKTGPAAVGIAANDFWNVYSRDVSSEWDWRADGTVLNLKWTDGVASPASLTVSNAAGMWFTLLDDAMMESYLYPLSRSGVISSTLSNLPPQRYDFYVYAHGRTDDENAVIELKVGGVSVSTLATSSTAGWDGVAWIDGNQFVLFSGIEVPSGATVELISRPGVSGLAVINGLQLAAQSSALRIVTQPVSQTIAAGAQVVFSVQAQGEGTLSYQWMRNGVEISGATNSEFVISSAALSDAAGYSVRVQNSAATAVSQTATLIVTLGQRRLLNVDYSTTSEFGRKVGPAAVGLTSTDHWNLYSRDSQSLVNAPDGMKWSDGALAGAQLTVGNADGAWGAGSEDPMLHTYLYPLGRSGNIPSTFTQIPAGLYDVFVYAHGQPPEENGVIEVIVNGVSKGTKSTSSASDWDGPGWTEGKEYVLFAEVDIPTNAVVELIAKPGVSGISVINGAQFLSAPLAPTSPRVVDQPAGGTFFAGGTISLNVTAEGSRPLTYQWRHEGTNLVASDRITAVDTPYLTIADLRAEDAGSYSVFLQNSLGETNSENAIVAVTADVESPTVQITEPSPGPQGSQLFNLKGTVSDNNALASVVWERNGVPMGSLTLNEGGFNVSGLRFDPGETRIRVIATDISGNQSSAEVVSSFTVPRALVLGKVGPQQDGSRFVVPISLISTGGVSGGTFTLSFDTNYLADAMFEWADALSVGFATVNLETPRRFRATFALPGIGLASGSNHIATVSFRARSVANLIQTPLGIEVIGLYDEKGDAFVTGNSVSPTSLTITKRKIVGDNNANDRLDVGDASVMLRMVSRLEPVRFWDAALNDLNKNTDLDTGDAIRTLRAVVGLDPQPTVPVAPAPLAKKSSGQAADQTIAHITDAVGPVDPPAPVIPFWDGLLAPDKATAAPGEKITVEVRITQPMNGSKPISGASFRLEYPVDALKLDNATAHSVGSMVPSGSVSIWNVSPGQNNYETQNGAVSLAISSATAWPANTGTLARFTFTVQPGATTRYGWPIELRNLEVSRDGFQTEILGHGRWVFTGHSPNLPGLSSTITFSVEGRPKIVLNCDAGASYEILLSYDLQTWLQTGAIYSPNGVIEFEDPEPATAPARFYRARLIPNP